MEYKEYEEKCNDAKLYSDEVAIGYVTLGLCGELGELYEKISQEELGELGRKEIGDMLWYLAMMRRELNLSFIEKWPVAEEGLKIDPFVLVVEVGKIAEQVKKFMRDDWVPGQKNTFPEKRKEIVEKSWTSIVEMLSSLAKDKDTFNSSIEEIANENIEKLASRKQRNVIHGSGDNR